MSPLDRFLSLFTEVRQGEGRRAVWMAVKVFLLLLSYYLLKPVREALILTEWDWLTRSKLVGVQALVLILVVPAYGALARRVDRVRLIRLSTAFLILNLWVFAALHWSGAKVGMAFFVWLGIFNVLVVSQFWAFAADIYTREEGERLFAVLGVGATAGAWVGSLVAKDLYGQIGANGLMLLATLGLGLAVGLSVIAERLGGDPHRPPTAVPPDQPRLAEGFRLLFANRYLLLIAGVVVMLNFVNTNGETILAMLVGDHAAEVASATGEEPGTVIGTFYGDFYAWVNLLALGFQLFLVSRLFRWIGVGGALLILPLVALGGYSLIVLAPMLVGASVFPVVRAAKILENSADYSINNTSRHALFLPVERAEKYAAKPAIDTLGHRLGDLLQSVWVPLGTTYWAFSVREFALANLVFVGVWLLFVWGIWRRHRALPEPA